MRFLKDTLAWTLGILFPRTTIEEELAVMTSAELLERASSARMDSEPGKFAPIALFSYRDPLIRRAIWELKYRGDPRMAELLAGALYPAVLEALSDVFLFSGTAKVMLVPIPLSEKRFRERGFNQAELVACALAHESGGRMQVFPHVLRRTRDTKSQTSLPRKARLKNMAEAFSVPSPEELRGACVVLIDDVTTTGATFGEAVRVLSSAGARDIIAVAVAH